MVSREPIRLASMERDFLGYPEVRVLAMRDNLFHVKQAGVGRANTEHRLFGRLMFGCLELPALAG